MSFSTDSDNDVAPTKLTVKKKSLNFDLDPEYFPTCEICNKDFFTSCDICNLVLCKNHATKSSCEKGHDLNLFELTLEEDIAKSRRNIRPTNPRNHQQHNTCEIGICKGEVYSACPLCLRYLCYNHLDKSVCVNDHQIENRFTLTVDNALKSGPRSIENLSINTNRPESFEVDGSRKEGTTESIALNKRKKGINKKNLLKISVTKVRSM